MYVTTLGHAGGGERVQRGQLSRRISLRGHTMADADMAYLERDIDTALLPDENPDLRAEIVQTIGEEWLFAKNSWLGGKTPNEVIGTPNEYKVRDIVRSYLVAALS